jgi:hypothetical protein
MNEGTRRCRAGSASRLRNPDSVTSRTRRRTPSNLVRTYPSATTAVTALIAGYRRGDDVVIAACETGPGRLFFYLRSCEDALGKPSSLLIIHFLSDVRGAS